MFWKLTIGKTCKRWYIIRSPFWISSIYILLSSTDCVFWNFTSIVDFWNNLSHGDIHKIISTIIKSTLLKGACCVNSLAFTVCNTPAAAAMAWEYSPRIYFSIFIFEGRECPICSENRALWWLFFKIMWYIHKGNGPSGPSCGWSYKVNLGSLCDS